MTSEHPDFIDSPLHGGEVFQIARLRGFDPRQIVDFSSNVNPLGPPPDVIRHLIDSAWMISYYPDISYQELREAIADYLGMSNTQNIVEGNGSTELIYLFTQLLIREGDKVLIPVPSFAEYERAVASQSGTPVYVATNLGTMKATDVLRDKLEGCKALYIANPNNPTSKSIPKKELLELVELAMDKNVYVLLDETFIEFTKQYDSSLASCVNEFPNLFIIRSFTKTFALPGLRVGYGLASSKLAERLRMKKAPWSVNILAQVAVMQALHDKVYMRKSRSLIEHERLFLFSELQKLSELEVYEPDANFLLLKILNSFTATELKNTLLDKRILIRDCSTFRGLDRSYFRISVRLRKENISLLAALKEVFR